MKFKPISGLFIPITDEDAQDQPGVSKETPETGGVSKETPDTVESGDVGGEQPSAEELRAQLEAAEAARAKMEQDLNNLKSASQRRQDETKQQYEKRLAAITDQLDEIQTANMDEVEKAQYEARRLKEKLEQERQERLEIQEQLKQRETFDQWSKQFAQAGIDINSMPGETYNDRLQAGLAAVFKKASGSEEPAPKKKGKEPVEAPDVLTDSPKETTGVPTVKDVISQERREGESPEQTLSRLYDEISRQARPPDILLGSPPSK